MNRPQQFQVKDSGVRAEYASGGVRDSNAGKPRFELLLPRGVPFADQFLTRCAAHMAKGADKYESRNWEKFDGLEELERARESAFRHLMQWLAGEDDEDHAAAVVFNLLAAETIEWKMGERVPTVSFGGITEWFKPAAGASPLGPNELLVNMGPS